MKLRAMLELYSTKQILTMWGVWARDNAKLGYKAQGVWQKWSVIEHALPLMDDDVALQIEKAVVLLKQKQPLLYDLLIATYVKRQPVESIVSNNKKKEMICRGILDEYQISHGTYKAGMKQLKIALKMMLLFKYNEPQE